MRAVFAALALCSFVGLAHAADRTERAQAIFDQSCSHCHVLGKKDGADAREKMVLDPTQAKWTPEWVRRWLDAPEKVEPMSMCLGARIDPVAKDLLVAFLRVKNTPGVRLDASRRGGNGDGRPPVIRRSNPKSIRGGQ